MLYTGVKYSVTPLKQYTPIDDTVITQFSFSAFFYFQILLPASAGSTKDNGKNKNTKEVTNRDEHVTTVARTTAAHGYLHIVV